MTTTRIIILTIIGTWLLAVPSSAQKKQLDEASVMLKSGKNLDKAEKLMTGLLKDSVNRTNQKIYALWFDIVEAQYEQANEKLYLKEKYDTAGSFLQHDPSVV